MISLALFVWQVLKNTIDYLNFIFLADATHFEHFMFSFNNWNIKQSYKLQLLYLGIAAIQVLNNSIFGSTFGFRSPLKNKNGQLVQNKIEGYWWVETN